VSAPTEELPLPVAAPSGLMSPLIVEADDTTWRTLEVFCLYRVVLSFFVGLAFLYLNRFFNLGIITPGTVLPTVVCYAVAS
jgi:hypothetical protein